MSKEEAMSNDSSPRIFEHATRTNVMAKIKSRELGVSVSCSASRRNRVGVGLCIRPGQCATTVGAFATEYSVHHGRRHRLDAAEHLSRGPGGRRNAEYRPHRP